MPESIQNLNFIRQFLIKHTKYNHSDIYLKNYYLDLLTNLRNKKTLMIAGPQGCGKSTISLLIKQYFKKFYSRDVAIISIDDFYLSSSKRKKLSKKYNTPLFNIRGVPGTHDLRSLLKTIKKLKNKNFPVYLPVFNKVSDNNKNYFRKINNADLIILEGWCVGSKVIENKFLIKNLNDLEKNKDSNFIWRYAYNNYLLKYQKIFKNFNNYIFFQIPDWKNVINWKYKQELGLRSKNKDIKLKIKLKEFIQYYQKISKWMSITSPSFSNILIKLDKNQKINKILYK